MITSRNEKDGKLVGYLAIGYLGRVSSEKEEWRVTYVAHPSEKITSVNIKTEKNPDDSELILEAYSMLRREGCI